MVYMYIHMCIYIYIYTHTAFETLEMHMSYHLHQCSNRAAWGGIKARMENPCPQWACFGILAVAHMMSWRPLHKDAVEL